MSGPLGAVDDGRRKAEGPERVYKVSIASVQTDVAKVYELRREYKFNGPCPNAWTTWTRPGAKTEKMDRAQKTSWNGGGPDGRPRRRGDACADQDDRFLPLVALAQFSSFPTHRPPKEKEDDAGQPTGEGKTGRRKSGRVRSSDTATDA